MRDGPITHSRSIAAPGRDASDGSYPGGKSGAGIYQRLINLIPRHRRPILRPVMGYSFSPIRHMSFQNGPAGKRTPMNSATMDTWIYSRS